MSLDSLTPADPQPSDAAPSELQPTPMMPGKYGGLLRRGNPGNKGNRTGSRSGIAREILEASTPEAAEILKRMSLQGKVGRGKATRHLSDPDRIKALIAHLDRGAVPARSELSAAEGVIVVAIRGKEDDELSAPAAGLLPPGPSPTG